MVPRSEIAVPTDAWFLSSPTLPPSRIMQGSLGAEAALGDGDYRLTGLSPGKWRVLAFVSENAQAEQTVEARAGLPVVCNLEIVTDVRR